MNDIEFEQQKASLKIKNLELQLEIQKRTIEQMKERENKTEKYVVMLFNKFEELEETNKIEQKSR